MTGNDQPDWRGLSVRSTTAGSHAVTARRGFTLRRALTAGLATAALFTVASCTDEPSGIPGTSRESSTTATSGSPASATSGPGGSAGPTAYTGPLSDESVSGPAPAVAEARAGGTLRIRTAHQPATLDPTGQFDESSDALLDLTTRRLTTYVQRDGAWLLVPDLAQDLGTVSDDGLTWTFTLKPGIRYHDGREVVAADFVHAVRRTFAREVFPSGATHLAQHLLGGDSYLGPYVDETALAGVSAPDDHTLVLRLREPWPTLPWFAASPQMSPIPESADTGAGYESEALATGPYVISSYEPGTSLLLTRNEHWDAASDPARHQFPETIEVSFGADWATSVERALSSTSDADRTSLVPDGVPDSSYELATGDKSTQVSSGIGNCVSYVSLDTEQLPLAVREAIAAAYPYDLVRQATGVTELDQTPATSVLPPGIPGVPAAEPIRDLDGVGAGDPRRAREILEKSGHLGFELIWTYADDEMSTRANNVVRAAMKDAGFEVRDDKVLAKKLSEYRLDPESPANMMQGPAGWCYDWPQGDAVLPALFGSAAVDSGSSAGRLQDDDVDAEIRRIRRLPAADQGPEWRTLEDTILREHLPALPVGYPRGTSVFGAGVHGVTIQPHTGMPAYSQIWVD